MDQKGTSIETSINNRPQDLHRTLSSIFSLESLEETALNTNKYDYFEKLFEHYYGGSITVLSQHSFLSSDELVQEAKANAIIVVNVIPYIFNATARSINHFEVRQEDYILTVNYNLNSQPQILIEMFKDRYLNYFLRNVWVERFCLNLDDYNGINSYQNFQDKTFMILDGDPEAAVMYTHLCRFTDIEIQPTSNNSAAIALKVRISKEVATKVFRP